MTFEQEILPLAGMESVAAGASRGHRDLYRYPNGTEVVLGGLDKPGRIFSTGWDIVYIAEATELDEEGYEIATSRLDRPGRPTALGWCLADTNPAAPSHWLKKRCDAGKTVLWETVHAANPGMHDGHFWTPAGKAALARLDRLTGTRRKRFRDGVWAAGEGQYFDGWDVATHVTPAAKYDPRLPVHLAVDSGVHTAAVWVQIRGQGDDARVTVFGDYYAFRLPPYDAAKAILAHGAKLCGGRFDHGHQDPAGDSDSPSGVIVNNEYRRARLFLEHWPSYPGSKVDGLSLVESFVSVSPPQLTVTPDCTNLIEGFANYRRAKKSNQYLDIPVERQHPFEDVLDALRGALMAALPGGRGPKPQFRRVRPGQLL